MKQIKITTKENKFCVIIGIGEKQLQSQYNNHETECCFSLQFTFTIRDKTTDSTIGKLQHYIVSDQLLETFPEYTDYINEKIEILNFKSQFIKKFRKHFKISDGILFSNKSMCSFSMRIDDLENALNDYEFFRENDIVFYGPQYSDPENYLFNPFGYRKINSISENKEFNIDKDMVLNYTFEPYCSDNELYEDLTNSELYKILNDNKCIIKVKNKIVLVTPEMKNLLLDITKEARNNNPSNNILSAIYFSIFAQGNLGFVTPYADDITNMDFIEEFVASIKQKSISIHTKDLNDNLINGYSLKKYQEDGVKYMITMKKLGIGFGLCDQMGLGKTLQAISVLNYFKEKKEKTLIVVKASLRNNWKEEIDKFTNLGSTVLKNKRNDGDFINDGGIFIIGYDYFKNNQWINNIEWDNIILDEAQEIKNPTTNRFNYIMQLKSKFRLFMTGTPIENSRMDLWSLFTFANPGSLGTRTEFRHKFMKNALPESIEALRKAIIPFHLKRTHSDAGENSFSDVKTILSFVDMVPYQKKSYQTYLTCMMNDNLNKFAMTGNPIRDNFLGAIANLRMISIHPDLATYGNQPTVSDGIKDINKSAKLLELVRIGEELHSNKENIIIFTNYRIMIPTIQHYMSEIYGNSGFSIDGNMNDSQKSAAIRHFDNMKQPTFIVISVKAGGAGLNLNKATSVIHLDLWWNPAIINQATARANRLGQTTKEIKEYMILTKGGIEENVIWKIINDKREMTDSIFPDDFDEQLEIMYTLLGGKKMTKKSFIDLISLH